jgi:hypothetical protein
MPGGARASSARRTDAVLWVLASISSRQQARSRTGDAFDCVRVWPTATRHTHTSQPQGTRLQGRRWGTRAVLSVVGAGRPPDAARGPTWATCAWAPAPRTGKPACLLRPARGRQQAPARVIDHFSSVSRNRRLAPSILSAGDEAQRMRTGRRARPEPFLPFSGSRRSCFSPAQAQQKTQRSSSTGRFRSLPNLSPARYFLLGSRAHAARFPFQTNRNCAQPQVSRLPPWSALPVSGDLSAPVPTPERCPLSPSRPPPLTSLTLLPVRWRRPRPTSPSLSISRPRSTRRRAPRRRRFTTPSTPCPKSSR